MPGSRQVPSRRRYRSMMEARAESSEDLINVPRLLLEAKKREEQLVDHLRCLVEIESPSSDKEAVERAQSLVADWAVAAGASIKRHEHAGYGDSFELRFSDYASAEKPILLLAIWTRCGITARSPPCLGRRPRMFWQVPVCLI